ncbi:hypothetical protein DPMN_072298 [Dreissena polymorpha]|uniref:Uncharacterized protein n=1 Tax=Dreissena polymorpha TaxID=45954 RepID=A0A9D4BWS1_DREPO|nr:hypothetical protein DPMN_072298 [Dreissena polymorpha]
MTVNIENYRGCKRCEQRIFFKVGASWAISKGSDSPIWVEIVLFQVQCHLCRNKTLIANKAAQKRKKGKKRNLSTPDGGSDQPDKRVVAQEPSTSALSMPSTAQCHQNFHSVNSIQSPNQLSYNMSRRLLFAAATARPLSDANNGTTVGSADRPPRARYDTNDNLSQILDRLNSVDSRIAKLDTIQSQLSELNTKMSSIETRVMSLETDSKEIHTRMSNIKGHCEFDSKQCEDIKRLNMFE